MASLVEGFSSFAVSSLNTYRKKTAAYLNNNAGASGSRRATRVLPPPRFLARHGYLPRLPDVERVVENLSTMEGVAMSENGNGFWSGRKVLVTGATGIIGSWLVKELVARSADVVALVLDSNPQTELYRSGTIGRVHVVNGRLEDFSTVNRAVVAYSVDTVLHLGAQAIVEVATMSPLATFETNIRGTWNVLEVCRQHRSFVERIVVASSDKAYGEQDDLPYTEDMALRPRYPYEVSKSCAI